MPSTQTDRRSPDPADVVEVLTALPPGRLRTALTLVVGDARLREASEIFNEQADVWARAHSTQLQDEAAKAAAQAHEIGDLSAPERDAGWQLSQETEQVIFLLDHVRGGREVLGELLERPALRGSMLRGLTVGNGVGHSALMLAMTDAGIVLEGDERQRAILRLRQTDQWRDVEHAVSSDDLVGTVRKLDASILRQLTTNHAAASRLRQLEAIGEAVAAASPDFFTEFPWATVTDVGGALDRVGLDASKTAIPALVGRIQSTFVKRVVSDSEIAATLMLYFPESRRAFTALLQSPDAVAQLNSEVPASVPLENEKWWLERALEQAGLREARRVTLTPELFEGTRPWNEIDPRLPSAHDVGTTFELLLAPEVRKPLAATLNDLLLPHVQGAGKPTGRTMSHRIRHDETGLAEQAHFRPAELAFFIDRVPEVATVFRAVLASNNARGQITLKATPDSGLITPGRDAVYNALLDALEDAGIELDREPSTLQPPDRRELETLRALSPTSSPKDVALHDAISAGLPEAVRLLQDDLPTLRRLIVTMNNERLLAAALDGRVGAAQALQQLATSGHEWARAMMQPHVPRVADRTMGPLVDNSPALSAVLLGTLRQPFVAGTLSHDFVGKGYHPTLAALQAGLDERGMALVQGPLTRPLVRPQAGGSIHVLPPPVIDVTAVGPGEFDPLAAVDGGANHTAAVDLTAVLELDGLVKAASHDVVQETDHGINPSHL